MQSFSLLVGIVARDIPSYYIMHIWLIVLLLEEF